MIRIKYHDEEKITEVGNSRTVLELVRDNFACTFTPCHRPGSCKRCRCLVFREGEADRTGFTALACSFRPEDGDVIECRFREPGQAEQRTVLCSSPEGQGNNQHHICVDLGSTTIVMSLEGRVWTSFNPQRRYGADVPSRIRAACEGEGERLRRLTEDCLLSACRELDPAGRASGVIISGNTTMLHLLRGFDCSTLGVAPFEPYSLKGESFKLGAYDAYSLPGISAFIGADIVSGLFYVQEKLALPGEDYLLLDLGTNGEMAAVSGGNILCTSVAAGPAFECTAPQGVYGADLISLIARLLREGIIDETGLMAEEYFETGYEVYINQNNSTEDDSQVRFVITPQLIRDIQLAKAAVYCGVCALARACGGFEAFDRIYIAGGMGNSVNAQDAVRIGLLPATAGGKVTGIGNSSLAGAELVSLLSPKAAAGLLDDIVSRAHLLQLPDMDGFGDEYIGALDFPKG